MTQITKNELMQQGPQMTRMNQTSFRRSVASAFALTVGALLVSAVHADAQSLAAVAKKESDRRGTVTSSGKVYTNGTLVEDFTKPVTPPPPPAAAPKAEPGAAAKTDKPTAEAEEPLQVPVAAEGTEVERQAPSDKGEDYYRGKATIFRNAIAALKAQIAGLETRVASLIEAKTGTDLRERDLSSQALQKAKADLASIEEDRARFEAIARARNAPPAWWQQ